jgi:hypothetical protein
VELEEEPAEKAAAIALVQAEEQVICVNHQNESM